MTEESKPPEEPRFPEILGLLAAILMIGIIGSVIAVKFFPSETNPNAPSQNAARWYFIIGGLAYLILPYFYLKGRGLKVKLLFRIGKVNPGVAVISLLMGLALIVLTDEIDRLITLIHETPVWLNDLLLPLKADTPLEWLLVFTGVVIIAPVCEEIFFRGFFQRTLEQQNEPTKAVLYTAIAWTVIHFNPYWAVQIFILGFFLGFVAWRTQSVFPSIIIHALNNILALIAMNTSAEYEISWYEWKGHVSPVLIAAAIGLLIWSIRQLNGIYRRAG